ncbi:glycosyltransferase family 2 protein [Geobacter sp. DSM 9736]|uniref:glycosyltransferase family 2 protein n=1 Tax=Geobacter sp. DSM 9736 TaxID=1277350 RepID=UPI000B50731F|nr:glycosyltransferase family 2 protein [Geobacter sp. DSM 9736]SNB46596.1 dolichol-phosphate mannosyltransferase [Geobacter sp. DSM 9736]
MSEKRISIVVPCHNEESNVGILLSRIMSTMSAIGLEYEVIFVDDGSTDRTLHVLKGLQDAHRNVRVVELSRNFGHQAAICAGLDTAKGDAVIMMDADLQHPPEVIAQLVMKWKEGFEVVYTVRNDPAGTPFLKKITARLFYRLVNLLAKIDIPYNSADFRLLDRKAAYHLLSLPEKTKFLRGLVNWIGFRRCGVTYEASLRNAGSTKYTFLKMLRFAIDGITSFSAFPLQLSTIMGMVVSLFSFAYAAYAIIMKLFSDYTIAGWASVLVSVLFLGGIQLMSLGIIGEYIDRIYTESKSRPMYIVRNIYGEDE